MIYTLSKLKKSNKKYYVPHYGWMLPDRAYHSTRKNKKAMVLSVKGGKAKIIHFGQKGYSDFRKHKDKQRRKNYLSRSAGIRDAQGRLTKNDKWSANYWSRKVLW